MPKKYIEREAYSKALKDLISDSDGRTNYEKGYIQGLATANGILLDEQQTPTADVVEVVRCKDCKYLMFSDFYGECSQGHMGIVYPTDYCSIGKRKEDNNA